MSTLLLRLAAPLQAWGVDSKFERRATARVPTKSGVVGLIAAALGRRRDENIGDLQGLRFGVRVDREGMLLRDYHTAHEDKFWSTFDGKYAHVTVRYYLADAVFLAGLEGADAFLLEIERALSYPVFPLFLGRRSCPPEGRLSLGIRTSKTLLEALQDEPWLLSEWLRVKKNYQVHLRIVAEAGADVETDVEPRGSYFQRDLPLSFDQTHRKFGFRHVFEFESQSVYNPLSRRPMSENSTGHDPMPELEGE